MDDYDNEDHWRPYPELVADGEGPYEIIDSRGLPGLPTVGMTDKTERVIWVPFDAEGRGVSQHELAHVIWSPECVDMQKLGAPLMAIRAIEDARVNLGLCAIGVPLAYAESLCAEVLGFVDQARESGHVASLTLCAVASFGTNLEHHILERVAGRATPALLIVSELASETRARLDRARRRAGDAVPSFWQGVRIARWLVRQLLAYGYVVPQGRDGALIGCGGGVGPATVGGRHPDALLSTHGLADGVLPGRLRIVTPALPHRYETPAAARERRARCATEEGTEIRYYHRFVYDRRIFARPVRRNVSGGGTVLLDASGSMGVRAADIDRFIMSVPDAALVATYAGSRGGTGELRIVARNGYRASVRDLSPKGAGNVVDLPALKWLARQPGPRLWISDGEVTGCGDVPTAAIRRRCREICKEAQIERVRRPALAAAALARARSRAGDGVRSA